MRAALEHAVFTAAERAVRAVVAHLFERAVLVAVIADRAIVRAKNNERVVGKFQPVEGLDQFANAPVELHDSVAAKAEAGCAVETFVRHARHVQIVRGEKQEERIVPVGLDPFVGLLHPLVGEVLVAETRRVAAGVKADPADAVMDGRVVPVAPVHLEGAAVRKPRRVVGAWLFPADPQRILWVEILHAMVHDINLWHAIVGGGQEVVEVKADFARAGFQVAVPIRPAWPA